MLGTLTVTGETLNEPETIEVFRGIPFAAPPVGPSAVDAAPTPIRLPRSN